MVYTAQIQRRVSRKLLTNGNRLVYLLAEGILQVISLKFYHRANNPGNYADKFHKSMINDKDGHIPSPLIMVMSTVLHHALLEWQKNKCFHPKASKSKLKADRPDQSNYYHLKNDGGNNASRCTTTGHQL